MAWAVLWLVTAAFLGASLTALPLPLPDRRRTGPVLDRVPPALLAILLLVAVLGLVGVAVAYRRLLADEPASIGLGALLGVSALGTAAVAAGGVYLAALPYSYGAAIPIFDWAYSALTVGAVTWRVASRGMSRALTAGLVAGLPVVAVHAFTWGLVGGPAGGYGAVAILDGIGVSIGLLPAIVSHQGQRSTHG
ncbi:MAG: hypothetical protein M3Z02_10740 [Actinomycetota bacterium]|nr:hypothetical protein [Actinomycetota bacterium]